jgi:hypothetical protein
MKAIGVILLIAAVAIAVVPQFTDCESQGRALTLQNGRSVPMKCHWTAQAALGLALPVAVVGALTLFRGRKPGATNLGIVGAGLGAIAILLPISLIGVCASPDMICNSVMRPFMILTGGVITVASAAGFLLASRDAARARAQAPAGQSGTPGIAL